jgi:hypothetical protein
VSDEKPLRRLGASALRGLVDGVGHQMTDRVRQEIGDARASGDANPAHLAQRAAAAALSGAAGGVGQNVAAMIRQEFGAVRDEAIASARTAGRAAGLLGGAAAAGNTAGLFVGIAVWRGLGNRIGFARSALVVAGLSGTLAAVLASRGTDELARVRAAKPAKPATPPAAGPPSTTIVPTIPIVDPKA